MKKWLLNPISMLVVGLCLGMVSRLLDIYTQNWGNIFSQFAIWILIGVLIAIYSDTKRKAMTNIAPFCFGMLITYYFAAWLTNGVYSEIYIIGWTIFAAFSPIMAYLAWRTKEPGIIAKCLGAGIVFFSVLSSIVLFDRLRIYDVIIDVLLVYFLFFQKAKR